MIVAKVSSSLSLYFQNSGKAIFKEYLPVAASIFSLSQKMKKTMAAKLYLNKWTQLNHKNGYYMDESQNVFSIS